MPSLCIQDLAIATAGNIQLGTLPPLGGLMTPINRLVPIDSEIQNGDVVVWTHGAMTNGTAEPWCHEEGSRVASSSGVGPFFPNEYYARGALGVIADCGLCPWDGRFSLQVNQAGESQRDIMRFVRNRISVPVVAVLDTRVRSPIVNTMRSTLGTTDPLLDIWKNAKRQNNRSDSDGSCGSERQDDAVLWQVLAMPSIESALVVHVPLDVTTSMLSILQPNIVVATNQVPESEVFRLIGLAGQNGILVLETTENESLAQRVENKGLPHSWRAVGSPADSGITEIALVAITRQSRQPVVCGTRVA